MKRVWPLCLTLAIRAFAAEAQEWRNPTPPPTLLVRVVAAGNGAAHGAVSQKLTDILPLLRENLRFQTYRLLRSRKITLREGGTLNLTDDLRLVLSEVRGAEFRVRVEKGSKCLIETRLRLRPGKPVILGGLPSDGEEKLLLVLQLPGPNPGP